MKILLNGHNIEFAVNTVNVDIFAGGKFREIVGKTFHVKVYFTILLLLYSTNETLSELIPKSMTLTFRLKWAFSDFATLFHTHLA